MDWYRKYRNELYHYGVKGMKWGVRRTPEQLGHTTKRVAKKSKNNTIILEAISNGDVSSTVNEEKQARHIKSHKGYISGRSYIDGDMDTAKKLVNELSGTGEAIIDSNGNWTKKERVQSSEIIGTHIDLHGNESTTSKAIISYSKTGSHIIPRGE